MSKSDTAGSAPSGVVTIDDLRSGRRARVTETELEQLGIRNRRSSQRDRLFGVGIPFQKDPDTKRVFYLAKDVLAYLDRPTHRSTSEYSTSAHHGRLEKARDAHAGNAAPR